jgi:hypothetical protein
MKKDQVPRKAINQLTRSKSLKSSRKLSKKVQLPVEVELLKKQLTLVSL